MSHALAPSHGKIRTWFTTVQAWRSERKIKSLASWEQERARGKTRFVIRTAMIYSLLMTAAEDFLNYGLTGESHLARFLFNAIFYSAGGIILGCVAWWDREKRYRNTLREIRIETIAAGAPRPAVRD